MAVVANADPLDIALNDVGEFIDVAGHAGDDTLAEVTAIANLWHNVYERAMTNVESGHDRDAAIAMLAAGEWCKAIRLIRALAAAHRAPS